jgi:hypothetical protein
MERHAMQMQAVIETIKNCGGEMRSGINWTWAEFPTEAACRACFLMIQEHVEHRGIYAPRSGERWAFRFR